ncbi:uncharacterized protein [Spinacia oleracea]|uniref:Uncharacterized protein isoform X1 n=2 Tax=Spinacia oleracea TaxID=3562 RepID=A0A9R0JLA2_SPIOL|nr:uncharacterized protein LOC110778669 isoform X1 [Spinacia oleracea]
MERESAGDDLQSLIEAIKASELVETRIQLIAKLGVPVPPNKSSDLDALLEFFITLWEGFTCLDESQCLLNKAMLDVAAKYLEGDSFGGQEKFLTLGAKASEWCAKHLKMTLMSTDDSQEEEHCSVFFQLLLECLNFSVGCFLLVIRNPTFGDEGLMDALVKFILENLNLIKDLISEFKKIHLSTSELLKGVELVLDSVMKLCKVYSQTVNWDLCGQIAVKDSSGLDGEGGADLNYVVKIIKCTIEKLSELGTLAADSGGSLVTVLNLSWKGVVSLLQLGEGKLAEKVNIGDIILILFSLATDSLKCAAESWYSSVGQTISVTEAKRALLPIKFYLINAVRISSQYPHQAFSVYQEATLCILLLTTLRVTFSSETSLKNVCEAMEELLKPTSLHVLKSLLNSAQLCKDQKLKILDWLFAFDRGLPSSNSHQDTDIQKGLLDEIFSVTCEAMPTARTLLLGQVALFIDLLKVCPDLEENVILGITTKMQLCLDVLVDEEVYSSALVLLIPASFADGKSSILTWEPFLVSFLRALKIFMIVISRTQVWSEMELFLLHNFFHPHFLCWEIIMELWCFLVRHAEDTTVNAVIDKLCSLYKMIASSNSLRTLHCTSLRKMARSMCLLLSSCTPSTVDRVYRIIMTDDRSHDSAVMYAALLMEGFQLNLLSDNLKIAATERIFSEYIHFVDNYTESPLDSCSSDALMLPAIALCSALQSMQIDASGIDRKTLKFLLVVLQTYKKSTDRITKNNCCRLLSEALGIISTAKHLYGNDQMEDIIIELKNMFISGPTGGESELQKCKSALASFMSSLGHMEMAENEENEKTSAVLHLYHMLLRERHWALIHLAISAFGYFAARTSCRQLWRFVPPDAALSYDGNTGTDINEEKFMSELKVILEKEAALPAATASTTEQLQLVLKDGLILRELFQKDSHLSIDAMECDIKVTRRENISNKRRKLPDGFCRGMELLQNGLKTMKDGLSLCQQDQPDSIEVDDKILIQFSHLEDMVNRLVGLADDG